MISPSHVRPQFSASELFTDREDARDIFRRALDEPQPAADYRVIMWHGAGGQGKSALQGEFTRILEQRHKQAVSLSAPRPGLALIDFQNPDNRAIATAMLTLRLSIGKTAAIRFPAFDVAFMRYFALSQPGRDLKTAHPELHASGAHVFDALSTLLEIAGMAIPGFSMFTKAGYERLSPEFKKWWDKRGRAVLYGIDELTQDQLLRALPKYFGADICEALTGERPPRIVIRFDTYEALWNDRQLKDGPGALLFDDWVRLLVQDSPGALFIFTGRDRLHWDEIDAGWGKIVEHHRLHGLSEQDAEAFLLKCKIDSSEIRARMIEGARGDDELATPLQESTSQGCLPYYLDLQVETFYDIKAKGAPAPEDFGGTHPQILARFLSHLDRETERLLYLASYPQKLDGEVLPVLAANAADGGTGQIDWTPVFSRSILTRQSDGAHAMHALMRESLQAREKSGQPGRYIGIHRALYEHHERLCREDDPKQIAAAHEQAFLAAARHFIEADAPAAVRWMNDQMQRFNASARWRTLETACLLAMPAAEGAYGAESTRYTANLLWLAKAYHENGKYREAETLYDRVCALQEKTLGPEHPNTAATLNDLAGVYYVTGRYAQAEDLFERSRAIYEKTLGAEHPNTATTLNNLAEIYRNTGRYALAEDLFERARAIYEKTLGAEHPNTATTLNNLAEIYRNTGRYAQAEDLFERVRTIEEKTLGPEHPSTATTLNNLGGVYLDTGRCAQAEDLFERVRKIQEKTLGAEHPDTARTLNNLALVYRDTGRYAQAEELYERVRTISEKTLGPEHPQTAITLANLAGVYRETDRLDDAEKLYAQALAVLTAKFRPGHPRIARVIAQRGALRVRQGRREEARRDLESALADFAAAGLLPEALYVREARAELEKLGKG
jgi:tetratricopeptide (TPR) repeat protein